MVASYDYLEFYRTSTFDTISPSFVVILIGSRFGWPTMDSLSLPEIVDMIHFTFLLSFLVGFMGSMFTFSLLKHSTKLLKMLLSFQLIVTTFGSMAPAWWWWRECQKHAVKRHEFGIVLEPRISMERVGNYR